MNDMTQPLLRVRNLTKRFPLHGGVLQRVTGHVNAVDGVSFDIDRGETLALVGESGCGKSTVGRTILKLHEPTDGTIELLGRNITGLSRRKMRPFRKQLQIVFQDPFSSLNPRMKAGDIVGEPLSIHRIATGREQQRLVAEVFERVGLRPDQMDRFPHEFSGGQRQRLSIATALIVRPQVIVADEPVSALDVSIQASIINLLIRLQKEMGLSFLFISHDMSVVEHVSHRVAVMYLGRIVELADRPELFSAPQHPYTEALLSAVPVPKPAVARKKRTILHGEIPSPINPPKGCHFHTRCPIAIERCRVESPALREVRPAHWAACHLR